MAGEVNLILSRKFTNWAERGWFFGLFAVLERKLEDKVDFRYAAMLQRQYFERF